MFDDELASYPPKDTSPAYQLCFYRVDPPKDGNDLALGWKGTQKTPEGFIRYPALFNWNLLGRVIGQALRAEKITSRDLHSFLKGLGECSDPAP